MIISRPYIHDSALAILLGDGDDRRYSWVKRALKKGTLVRLRRGFYLIPKEEGPPLDAFEMAQQLYSPSYISFESALSFHGWIPEAVYITTSATTKRNSFIQTPIGTFSYARTPLEQFFMGVDRLKTENSVYLMANPWKALCDYLYVRHKKWTTLADVQRDLRIEDSSLENTNISPLKEISEYYDSPRVRKFAQMILEELT